MADAPTPTKRPPAQVFNFVQVSHTPGEFFFVLGQRQAAQTTAPAYVEVQMISHVVTTPQKCCALVQR